MKASAQKVMNRLTQNFSSIDVDVEEQVYFANFSIDRLRRLCRDSKQKIMLETILVGLKNHPVYSRFYDELREEFAAGVSAN